MNKILLIALTLSCISLLLISCGDAPKKEAAPAEIVDNTISFNGQDVRLDTLNVDGAQSVTMEFSIKSTNAGGNYGFTDNAPPMPLLLSSPATLAIYQVSDTHYKIGDRLVPMIINEWSDIRVTLSLSDNSITIDATNLPGQVKDPLKTPRIGTVLSIGKGFKERFWKGEIKDFTVKVDGREAVAF